MLDDVDSKNEIKAMSKWNGILKIGLFKKSLRHSIAGLFNSVMGNIYT